MKNEPSGAGNTDKKQLYDYIIIGTGPAGAVLAKLLSDDKKTTVLVLEAGDNNDKEEPIRNSTFAPELEEQFFADEGFLVNSADLQAVRNIFRGTLLQIADELRRIDPEYRLVTPSVDVINDDVQLDEYIKQNFGHNHHQQGSLRMAPLKKGGVVDRRGNVYGVRDLIVADDSIIPFTVDGNASAPAYLIGYTIANHLKTAHRPKLKMRVPLEEEE